MIKTNLMNSLSYSISHKALSGYPLYPAGHPNTHYGPATRKN